MGRRNYGVDPDMCVFIAQQVKEVVDEGVQVAIVVGGGNIFRGLAASASGMRIPIQYALTYPNHLPSPAPRLSGADIPTLQFEPVDEARFPALAIGRAAGRQSPRASAALIAADDVAVERFLNGTIDFPGIAELCAGAVERFGGGELWRHA